MTVKKDDMKWNNNSWSKPPLPKLSNPDNFVRAEDGCYEIVHSEAWGTGLYKIEDPEGKKITYKDKNTFKLVENFPRIPKEIWAAWTSLAFHFCEEPKSTGYGHYSSDDNEVSVVFLRKEDDLSQWKAVVPLQEVSGGAVHADFTESCDLLTGEKYDVFPPVGYLHVGSSHSHNTMGSFFSGTDDRSELGIPGIHIVVGKIDTKKMTYTYKASIVLKGQRKIIEELDDVVDCAPFLSPFHAICLEMVHEKQVIVTSNKHGKKFHGFGKHGGGKHNGGNSSGGYGRNTGYGGNYSPPNTYKPGALWDNVRSEWVYIDDDDDDENTSIILLPGDVDFQNNLPNGAEPYTPYEGDAYEEYKNLTDQVYTDDFSVSDLDDLSKQSISEWVGHEVTDDDAEWLKEFLKRA